MNFIRKNILSFVADDRWTIWFFENEGPGMYTKTAAGWVTYAHTITIGQDLIDQQQSLTDQPRSIRLVTLDHTGELTDPTCSANFWKIAPVATPHPSDDEIMSAWTKWAERQKSE